MKTIDFWKGTKSFLLEYYWNDAKNESYEKWELSQPSFPPSPSPFSNLELDERIVVSLGLLY